MEIYCRYSELIDPHELQPHPRNPNTHSALQIEKLAAVINGAGWRQPITVSNRSGLVIKGHGRLQAALDYGISPVPVEYQDYKDETEEISDMIADNKLAEMSIFDEKAIEDLLASLQGLGAEISLTGFDLQGFEIDELSIVLGKIEQAQEYIAEAEDKAQKIREQVDNVLDRLKEDAFEELANALCVIVPIGRSKPGDCVVITDPALSDVVSELKRYADDGAESPCAALLEGLISFAPDAGNNRKGV